MDRFLGVILLILTALVPGMANSKDPEKGAFLALDEQGADAMEFGLDFADRMLTQMPEQGFEILAGGHSIGLLLQDSPVLVELETVRSKHPGLVLSACKQTLDLLREHEGPESAILARGVKEVDCDKRFGDLSRKGWYRVAAPE